GGRITFSLSETANQALATLAQEYQASPFMVLLAGFAVLLYRYSGQTDLRLGLPLATRQRPETQQLIGYLVNTVVFVCRIQGQDSFVSVLSQTKQRLLDAEAHPDVPFEHVVDAINPERRLGQNPLFQILVNHQQITDSLAIHGWHIQSQQLDNRAAQFDLSLDTQQDRHGHISGFFAYASELFAANTIQRLSDAYQHLLCELLAAPEQPIAWHSLVNQDLADYHIEYPDGTEQVSYVHQRIRVMAQSQPHAIAIIDGGRLISYSELECQSNRLAHLLQCCGLRPDDIVGLLMPRTGDSVVAMLAVLKAGGAFLPLSPDSPKARLVQALRDAGVKQVLYGCPPSQDSAELSAELGLSAKILVAQEPWQLWLSTDGGAHLPEQLTLADQSDTPPNVVLHPDNAAYLIHTSGSTGTPKAVCVSHGALAKHCHAIAQTYAMRQDDCALHFAEFTFDAAMEQWLVPLITGCRLLMRDSLWSAEQAYLMLSKHKVTWFEMPPGYLAELAQWLVSQGKTLSLRACSVGGEAVPKDILVLFRQALGDIPIINGYGPTETLITPLTWTALPDTDCTTAYAPIGTAVGQRYGYVVDRDLNRLPDGVIGELALGGPYLARGYQHKPGLTAERFVPNPFLSDGSRMYLTGDLVRRLPDGMMAYLGRLDNQVKLRGFRIELGEIETGLLSHPAVQEAVVIIDNSTANHRLLAYWAATAAHDDTKEEDLSQYLQNVVTGLHDSGGDYSIKGVTAS
ncbi:non-ribosomal peptide synthetase, partial [Methylocucumis oryzae]|uniref:non-ribosomal peptide synthetase n=1 Tax=Methylocucumis oryzae TaxID=1632867 RepID=UPI000A609B98